MTGRIALNAFVALAAAFLVLPILAIVPAAFSAQSFIRLPPDAWSVRWWSTFFADASWRVTLLVSLEVAALTTLISVVAGTAAALGLARSGARARALSTALFLGPVVTPAIVLAVALYSMARATGLVGTTTALVIAHTTLALPFVVLNVGVSLDGLDRRLLLAAAGLGADDFRIFKAFLRQVISFESLIGDGGRISTGFFQRAFAHNKAEINQPVFDLSKTAIPLWEEIELDLIIDSLNASEVGFQGVESRASSTGNAFTPINHEPRVSARGINNYRRFKADTLTVRK